MKTQSIYSTVAFFEIVLLLFAVRCSLSLSYFTTAADSHVNVLLTCGLGFSSRTAPLNDSIGTTNLPLPLFLMNYPYHACFSVDSLENHGVLLLWDSAMPRIKREFDEMSRTQAPYR